MNAYVLRLYMEMARHYDGIRERIKKLDPEKHEEAIKWLHEASNKLSEAQECIYNASNRLSNDDVAEPN